MEPRTQPNYFDLMARLGPDSVQKQEHTDVLSLSKGDIVALVLLTPGAPEEKEDVYEYLCRQYLDELGAASRGGYRIRHLFSRLMASRSLAPALDQVNAVGGGAALNLLTKDQSKALIAAVRRQATFSGDVKVLAYVASRFGSQSAANAISQMKADEVNKVVLIPVFPSYASALCDFSSSLWKGFQKGGDMSSVDTTWISPSFSSPGFAQSTNDRIEQALQRYPGSIRNDVHIVFVARWSGQSAWIRRSTKIPAQVSETVAGIVQWSRRDYSFSIGHLGSGRFRPRNPFSIRTQLHMLRGAGKRAVLVVPVDHVSEQLDSAYRIDVQLRSLAAEFGFDEFHVASAVNCHPSFINSLAEQVTNRMRPV